jgi:hypothetical protein
MATRWTITCAICSKKENFGDAKDVTYAKWKIIAWNVNNAEPKCVCPTCEYYPRKKKYKDDEDEENS